jgi:hypothetical protein
MRQVVLSAWLCGRQRRISDSRGSRFGADDGKLSLPCRTHPSCKGILTQRMIVRREFIMTIGHSKTVEAFLKNAARKRKFTVICALGQYALARWVRGLVRVPGMDVLDRLFADASVRRALTTTTLRPTLPKRTTFRDGVSA